MSQEPTNRQLVQAKNFYEAGCRFLHNNIEQICTDPTHRHCCVSAISDALASFALLKLITDEQHQFLVKSLNECLEYEITKFNEKE